MRFNFNLFVCFSRTREFPEVDYREQEEEYFEIVQLIHLEEQSGKHDIEFWSDLDGHSDTRYELFDH